ncbi:hypothetical protein D3C84_357120 [compost metagenome]
MQLECVELVSLAAVVTHVIPGNGQGAVTGRIKVVMDQIGALRRTAAGRADGSAAGIDVGEKGRNHWPAGGLHTIGGIGGLATAAKCYVAVIVDGNGGVVGTEEVKSVRPKNSCEADVRRVAVIISSELVFTETVSSP